MSAFYPLQTTFNKGELSPLLGSRVDIDLWRQSLAYCRNFSVLSHGGIRRRSGTKFIGAVRNSNVAARLFPFIFSQDQSYVLSLNNSYIQFFAERGVVETSPGVRYEVVTPWNAAALPGLSYAQFNDVAYFAHQDSAPRHLERAAETNWTLSLQEYKDGPYLDTNTTATTLTPAATADLLDVAGTLTSLATEEAGRDVSKIVDNDPGTLMQVLTRTNTITHTFSSGTHVADAYYLRASFAGSQSPAAWRLEGYDGANWIVLDSRQGEVNWGNGEVRFFTFNNSTAYEAYRLAILATADEDTQSMTIAEWGLHTSVATQTAFNLTASSTTGINDGTGFQTTDVGRPIRLLCSDGHWRWGKIVARTSTTVVTFKMYDHALPDTSPIASWRLGAWSDESGWPGCVGLYNERLTWGRTDAKPVTVWGSKQAVFDDYGISEPLLSTDAMTITLLSSNMNELLWLADDVDLVTGSAGQVRSIGPADTTREFSATNITQRKGPTSGAEAIQPLSIGGTILYVGAGGTKIRELVMGEQGRYVAPELSIIGEHFFKSGIKEWAFAERPDPTVWCVLNSGILIAVVYDREQRVIGFSSHDVGGTVESVAVVPGIENGYDDVYLVVNRTINSATVRYIEVMERPFDGDTDVLEDGFFVDCGLTYDGSAATIINDLDHLIGEEVIVLADGAVVEGLTVSEFGQIELPYAASVVHVGLPYTSRAITLPVSGPGQDGTLFGRRKTVVATLADVLHTASLKVGFHTTWATTEQQILKPNDYVFGNPLDTVTGFIRCDFDGSWAEGNGQIVIETAEPLPCLVRSVALQVEAEP